MFFVLVFSQNVFFSLQTKGQEHFYLLWMRFPKSGSSERAAIFPMEMHKKFLSKLDCFRSDFLLFQEATVWCGGSKVCKTSPPHDNVSTFVTEADGCSVNKNLSSLMERAKGLFGLSLELLLLPPRQGLGQLSRRKAAAAAVSRSLGSTIGSSSSDKWPRQLRWWKAFFQGLADRRWPCVQTAVINSRLARKARKAAECRLTFNVGAKIPSSFFAYFFDGTFWCSPCASGSPPGRSWPRPCSSRCFELNNRATKHDYFLMKLSWKQFVDGLCKCQRRLPRIM